MLSFDKIQIGNYTVNITIYRLFNEFVQKILLRSTNFIFLCFVILYTRVHLRENQIFERFYDAKTIYVHITVHPLPHTKKKKTRALQI